MFLTFLLLAIAVVIVPAQVVADSTFTNTLVDLGISKALAWVIVSVIGIVVGKVWKQKWTDPLQIVLKVAQAIVVILVWLNEKVNNVSDKQSFALKTPKSHDRKSGIKQQLMSVFKVFVLGLFLSGIGLTASAQKWDGFFKPVDKQMFSFKADEGQAASSQWLFRPKATISAMKITQDKLTKEVITSSFTSGGVGIGYEHFTPVNGEPYNNFGVEAILLIDAIPTETTKTGISAVIAVSALKILSAGPGYDFANKQFFALVGITLDFN